VKVHQELRIGPLTSDQETGFISWIAEHPTDKWSRDLAREDELNREPGAKFYCFACEEMPEIPAATLLLIHPARRATSWLYASNIIPRSVRELTIDQYNLILRDFHDRLVKPGAKVIGVPVELSPSDQSIEDWLSPESAKLLKAFSHGANKSTGSSHPMDRQRWCDFLIALHRAGEILDEGLLERWLVEEEKWPDDVALDLICEYEFGRYLLGRFDSQ
jgi:hypothetical protein